MALGQIVADFQGQGELLGQIGDGDAVEARVFLDDQLLGVGLAVGGEADLVGAGDGHRALRVAAPQHHAFEGLRRRVAHIPGETVESGAIRGIHRAAAAPTTAASAPTSSARIAFGAGIAGGSRTRLSRGSIRGGSSRASSSTASSTASASGLIVGRAGEGADHLAFGIEDVDGDLVGGLGQVIVDARLADVALGFGRLKEVHVLGDQRRLQLAQRSDVVEHVERAAVGGDHHVVAFDHDIGDLRIGQIEREGLPLRAIVEGNVDAVLGAGEQQALAAGIFAHGVHEIVFGDAVDDLGPGLAVVGGLEDVGLAVVVLIILHRHVGGAGIVRRGVDQADAAEIGHAGRRDLGPWSCRRRA